uniref:ADP-ribosyltransferase n=1 Tax=Clostridioides sp. ES-S-0107-01 TaxID=2770772 RepID=UPI001E478684|nr:ADP-ribosyltransferase [Clostridioides sp. ES-S-0107-01]UDN53089.1 hypothetical protein JJC16_19160 [Clostridioides sp. ES-S-0107-01]
MLNNFFNERVKRYGYINRTLSNKSKYKRFRSVKEADNWGNTYYKSWAEKYLKTIKITKIARTDFLKPIETYCGEGYREINSYLRNVKDRKKDCDYIYHELSHILTMVLSSAPKIPDNIITYRLVDDNFIKKLIINNKKNPYSAIQEKGFLSTSLSTNIVKSSQPYADYENLLKIYVRKNSIGVYVNTVTIRKEQELLLYPGGHLALIRYPYINIILNKRIYECELIYPECLYDY